MIAFGRHSCGFGLGPADDDYSFHINVARSRHGWQSNALGSPSLERHCMTRDEFISHKTESELRISRQVIPVGIVYSVRLAAAFSSVVLAVLLFRYFSTDARTTILLAFGVCVLLFFVSFPAERHSRSRFFTLALKCPFCQSCLVFIRAQKTLETGCCYHCGKSVFDL